MSTPSQTLAASPKGCWVGASSKAEEKPTTKCWIAVYGSLLGAFMAVLDIQITNSSLKDIQGAMGASPDEGSWISTSYLVAEIVVIPLTGWLSSVFSVRRYMLVNSALFLLFSCLCAMAWNLDSLIVFRACQGFTGGVLIPMAFTIILTTLPPSRQPFGMAMFGVTATFAPAIGPSVGGWLTETYSWHWIFYLNLIPGALLMGAVWYAISPQPLKLNLLRGADWWGIVTMAVGLGTLTVFLEEGNRKDWFGSPLITRLAWIAAISLIAFVIIELRRDRPLLNLRVILRRNFGLATIVNFVLGIGLYGSVYILPLYLGQIQGYNAMQIGTVIAWAGFPQLVVFPLIPRVMKFIDLRVMVVIGTTLFGASCLMTSFMTNLTAYDQLIWSQLVRALGQPFIIVPLSSLATGLIEPQNATSASSLFNMMRNLGGSVGIAILAAMLTRREQFHSTRDGEYITTFNPAVQARTSQIAAGLVARGTAPTEAKMMALKVVDNTVRREANVKAYNDCFFIVGMLLLLSGFSALLCKKVKAGAGGGGH